jgi:glycosyltransferase involved in cell wall biosynthesis
MRLAQAFEQLLNNRKQLPEMGRAAREHVALHYSPAAWLDQLLTLYSEVCVVDQRVLPLSEAN